MKTFIPALKPRPKKEDPFRGGFEAYATKFLNRIGEPTKHYRHPRRGGKPPLPPGTNIPGSKGRPIGRRGRSGNFYADGPAAGLTPGQAFEKLRSSYSKMSDSERKSYEDRAYGGDIRSSREKKRLRGNGQGSGSAYASRFTGGGKPGNASGSVKKSGSGGVFSSIVSRAKNALGANSPEKPDSSKPLKGGENFDGKGVLIGYRDGKKLYDDSESTAQADKMAKEQTKANYEKPEVSKVDASLQKDHPVTAAYRKRDMDQASAKATKEKQRQAMIDRRMNRPDYMTERRNRRSRGVKHREEERKKNDPSNLSPGDKAFNDYASRFKKKKY